MKKIKTGKTLYQYGRGILLFTAAIHILLTILIIGIFLASGGDDFMRSDFGNAWVMLTNRYSNVAEDFLHSTKSNLITTLGVGLFSLSILKFAFKRGERWAWFTVWILPLSMVEDILYGISKGFGFQYLFGGLVALAALGLVISYQEIFKEVKT